MALSVWEKIRHGGTTIITLEALTAIVRITKATFASLLPIDTSRVHFGDQPYAALTKEIIEATRENVVPGQA